MSFIDLGVELEIPGLGLKISEGNELRLVAEVKHLIPGAGDPYLSISGNLIQPFDDAAESGLRLVHAGLTGLPLPQLAGTCGDQNQDNKVDVADAVIDAQIAAVLIDPDTISAVFSDLNSDGFLDVLDTVAVLQHVVDSTVPETCGPPGAEFITQ